MSRLWLLSLALLACTPTQIGDSSYMLASAESTPELPPLYDGIPLDAHLLRLDKQALEAAYIEHLTKLFSVWLSSQAPTHAKEITNGLRIARRAYGQAASQIAKREQEMLQQTDQK